MYGTAIALPARRLATLLALVGFAFGFTAVTVAAAQQPAHAICVFSPFTGSWKNVNPNTNAMTRVAITTSCNGAAHTVQAWGKCHPSDCYWGAQSTVNAGDGWLRATYNFGFKTSTVWLKTYVYSGRTYLRVYVNNDFTPADGRTDYVTDEWMLK